MTDHKVCLICIDGWGVAPPGPGNAITNANTPVMRGLKESGLSCEIDASGLSVGLPAGLMGNSEGNPTPNPDDPNHKLNHAMPHPQSGTCTLARAAAIMEVCTTGGRGRGDASLATRWVGGSPCTPGPAWQVRLGGAVPSPDPACASLPPFASSSPRPQIW
jgi:hypothetical protein